ncbi:MAG: hypothetical protein ACKVT2_04545 [Saprospiraceae bacterium]
MHLKLVTATALFVLITATFSWQGCKKEEPKDPECNLPNATLSYTLNIKHIIDQQCLGCHGGIGPGPDNYSTYEGIKPHLDEGHVLERVVIEKSMPEGGGMSQAQRDSINCWIAAGYPK